MYIYMTLLSYLQKQSNNKNKFQYNISLEKMENDLGMRECTSYLLLHNKPIPNFVA